jgi:hypothetical protein
MRGSSPRMTTARIKLIGNRFSVAGFFYQRLSLYCTFLLKPFEAKITKIQIANMNASPTTSSIAIPPYANAA